LDGCCAEREDRDLSGVEVVLGVAALLIGATGTWSPCGFSMVETIGLRGHSGGRSTTLAACATFAPGALAGGVATFGLLAVAGHLILGSAGTTAYLVAAAIAFGAAALDARGGRIVPQVRRQLPEGWRWSMPLPVAAALYGILLGLGFTTFVLSYGAWALAGISFAVGRPEVGLVVGLAFGIGRALPIVVLAPITDRPVGIRLTALMAERPSLYRVFRLGDATALLAGAAALLIGTGALAARTEVHHGADPSAAGHYLAYQRADGSAALRHGGSVTGLGGQQPAVGGPYVAVARAGKIELRRRRDPKKNVAAMPAKKVEALAISEGWLAFLRAHHGRDVLLARPIRAHAHLGKVRQVARAPHPARLDHPSLDGGALVYAVAKRRHSAIVLRHLNSGKKRTLVSVTRGQVTSPSIHNDHVVYVLARREREDDQATYVPALDQSLVLQGTKGSDSGKAIYTKVGSGKTLWSTALTSHRAFVTVLAHRRDRILSVAR
jgi:hypothetical protein